MDVFKSIGLLAVGLLLVTEEINAEEKGSAWFAGGGYYRNYLTGGGEGTGLFSFSPAPTKGGVDLHIGKNIFDNSKLMLGYRTFQNTSLDFFSCQTNGQCADRFSSSKLNSFYLNFRPHWAITQHFLLYGELGVQNYITKTRLSIQSFTDMTRNTTIEEESFAFQSNESEIRISWGFGAVYRWDNHDLSFGFSAYHLGDADLFTSLALQYDYHFDL